MRTDEFLARLENVKGAGPALWSARCPAHEDRNASLSVRENDQGWTILKCHTGCTAEDIVAAMHLTLADLFPERPDGDRHPLLPRPVPEPEPFRLTEDDVRGWERRLQANYGLLDRLWELKCWSPDALSGLGIGFDGERLTLPFWDIGFDPEGPGDHLCGLVRYAPGGSPKTLAVKGTRRDLWPAPETLLEGPILLVEGEPDAISAASLGVNACALPGVAKWDDSWPARFTGRRVIVMTDCDKPGRTAAARAASELSAVTWVRRVDLAPDRDDGFDLGDLLLAQREKGQLEVFTARLKALLQD